MAEHFLGTNVEVLYYDQHDNECFYVATIVDICEYGEILVQFNETGVRDWVCVGCVYVTDMSLPRKKSVIIGEKIEAQFRDRQFGMGWCEAHVVACNDKDIVVKFKTTHGHMKWSLEIDDIRAVNVNRVSIEQLIEAAQSLEMLKNQFIRPVDHGHLNRHGVGEQCND